MPTTINGRSVWMDDEALTILNMKKEELRKTTTNPTFGDAVRAMKLEIEIK